MNLATMFAIRIIIHDVSPQKNKLS